MSFVGDLFDPPKPHVKAPPPPPPPPTRNDAAAVTQRRQDQERRRRVLTAGGNGTMLTGTAGVPNELTGTRMLTGGD